MVKTFRKEMPPFVVGQEWHPPSAQESQLVAIAGHMRTLDGLSMGIEGKGNAAIALEQGTEVVDPPAEITGWV